MHMWLIYRAQSTSYFYLYLGSIGLYDTATIGTKYIARERPNISYKITTCFSIWTIFLHVIRRGWCHYRTYTKWYRCKIYFINFYNTFFVHLAYIIFISYFSAYVEMVSGSYSNDAIAKRGRSSYSHIRTANWISQYSHEVRSIQCVNVKM